MKFKLAVILSIIFHISLLAIAIYMPDIRTKKTGTIYYVDLINMPGGGGVRGSLDTKKGDTTAEKSGASLVTDKSVGVNDITLNK